MSAAVPSLLSGGRALSASSNFLRAWAQQPPGCSPAVCDSPGSCPRGDTQKSRSGTSPRVPLSGWAGTHRVRWAAQPPGPSGTATYSSWFGPFSQAHGVPEGWSHRRGAPRASPTAGAVLRTPAADDPPLPAAPSWTWSAGTASAPAAPIPAPAGTAGWPSRRGKVRSDSERPAGIPHPASLPLLSKSDPLRWAPIWLWAMASGETKLQGITDGSFGAFMMGVEISFFSQFSQA